MSEDKLFIKDEHGKFAGSISTGGKNKVPTASNSRRLNLGYPIEVTPEVDSYLDARKKYEAAHAIWADNKLPTVVREEQRQEMLRLDGKMRSHDVETILTGWEIYDKKRQGQGLSSDDLKYPNTVVDTIARSILEGAVNPDSIQQFIPAMAVEFTLPNGRTGYDLAYYDYVDATRPIFARESDILVGANINYLDPHVFEINKHNAYCAFSSGESLAGFGEEEDGAKAGEDSFFTAVDLDMLQRWVNEKPKVIRIKSLRFVRKQENEEDSNLSKAE